MTIQQRPRVMFLCTGNSCRSQMAEGWARHLHGDRLDACSAGTEPTGVNPFAVRAMLEVGVDISRQTSKTADRCEPDTLDLVITVCGSAHERCPAFLMSGSRTRIVHHGFDDPPHLAKDAANDEDVMAPYRRVRDEIRAFVEVLPDLLMKPTTVTEANAE